MAELKKVADPVRRDGRSRVAVRAGGAPSGGRGAVPPGQGAVPPTPGPDPCLARQPAMTAEPASVDVAIAGPPCQAFSNGQLAGSSGGRGIRTHVTVARQAVFKTAALGHYASPPGHTAYAEQRPKPRRDTARLAPDATIPASSPPARASLAPDVLPLHSTLQETQQGCLIHRHYGELPYRRADPADRVTTRRCAGVPGSSS